MIGRPQNSFLGFVWSRCEWKCLRRSFRYRFHAQNGIGRGESHVRESGELYAWTLRFKAAAAILLLAISKSFKRIQRGQLGLRAKASHLTAGVTYAYEVQRGLKTGV
jgi:hypothetical protein